MEIAKILHDLTRRMTGSSETPLLDAQVLLAHVLGRPRTWILTHPETSLAAEQLVALESSLACLEAGLPLPYLLGRWEFFGLSFLVNPAVLIPRPETELLVETALAWLDEKRAPTALHAADIGTGSGCIAISLAVYEPRLKVIASDISRSALQIARKNVQAHQLADRVYCLQADLASPFGELAFDLVCANLPYIPTHSLQALAIYDREPALALDGGPDGLTCISRLLPQVKTCLVSGGLLLVEIEASQGQAVLDLARRHLPRAQVSLLQDLAGKDRLIKVILPTSS